MKISYLILAHNNFEHLDRLVESLDNPDASFFVHIDKKCTTDYHPLLSKVQVMKIYPINWGGFAMIEATLALLNKAIEAVPQTDYFVLISGADYPIRPAGFLTRQLAKGKEFIDSAPLPFPDKPMGRFEYYYFDVNRRKYGYFHPLIFTEMALRLFKMKRKIPFEIHVGGQWFALTAQCVDYILKTVREDKKYENYFRHSLIPDEAFFQTIIAHSPFAKNTAPNFTYTDWSGANPPAIIGAKHIDILKNESRFEDEYGVRYPYFARKFNDESEEIISRIENELRS